MRIVLLTRSHSILEQSLAFRRNEGLEFTEFGWNGFLFDIPEEVRFTRYGGNTKKGSFMLEADTYLIEGKWEPIPKRRRPLSAIAATLVDKLGDQYGKKRRRPMKQKVAILEKSDARVFSHDALFMVVKAQNPERLYMWYCDESSRVIILRFIFGEFDVSAKKIVKRVLESFECHKEGDSYAWSLLNLRFETPKDYLLTDTKIAVGRARFIFSATRVTTFTERVTTLIVEYYSMANVVFQDELDDLDRWFKNHYEKDLCKQLKKRSIKFVLAEPRKMRKHELVIKESEGKTGLSWRGTTHFTNAVWYCPESNRVYIVTFTHTLSRPVILKRQIQESDYRNPVDSLFKSFKCH
jgi:hypothetical protein